VAIDTALRYNLAGDYNKALDIIAKAEGQDEFNLNKLKIQTLKKMGNFEEALKLAQFYINKTKVSQSPDDLLNLLDIYNIKCDIYLQVGQLNQVESEFELSKMIINRIKTKGHSSIGNFHYYNGLYYNEKSDFSRSEKHLDLAKQIYSTTNYDEGIAAVNYVSALNQRIKGNYEEALSLGTASLKQRRKIKDIFDIAGSLNLIGTIHLRMGNLDDAMNSFRECLSLNLKVGNKLELSRILSNMGVIYKMQGNLEEALSNYKKGLELFEDLGVEESVNKLKLNIGNIHLDQGEIIQAIDFYQQIYPYFTSASNDEILSLLLNNMGMAYKKQGEYSEALEKYKESIAIKQKIGNQVEIAAALHSIGSIYLLRGELKQALEHLTESLKVWEKEKNKIEISEILKDIGLAHFYQGNINKANDQLQKSLHLRREIGNKILIAETIYYLIVILLEIESDELVERYHRELKEISESLDNKNVKIQYQLATASILQKSPRIASKVEANELFEEVISEGIVDNEFTKFAMLNLCEFLIIELKSSGDREILLEIQSLLEKLYDMATEQESHTLLIEVLIIQSKVALVNYQVQEAEEYLKHAYEISDQKGLSQYSLKITYLMRQLQEETEKMSLLASESPIDKRIEQLDIESYIKEAAMVRNVGLDEIVDQSGDPTNMVVHDIKNLIQVNLNFAHLLLLDKRLPAEMKSYVHFIELSTKEMQLLISSLLTTEKLENGTFNLLLETVDVWDLIDRRMDMYQFRFDQNKLKVDLERETEDILVSADKFLFRRILDNLIINAGKFTPRNGTIVIKTKDSGDFWEIEFENDCDPIPMEYHEKLFEKYEQYQVTKLTKKQGVGLGLAFCKQALLSMGGDISLISPIPDKEDGVRIIVKMKKSPD
jgi:tetratricopeptide (TPR) repeat protein